MPLTTVYLTRHGFRLNWTVNPHTGTYSATHNSPTGIPSDPPLAAHGVAQSHQLAIHLSQLSEQGPPIAKVYSSPFYRCLQTIQPYIESRTPGEAEVRGDNGVGEWYGRARFTHPSPAPPWRLKQLFPFYNTNYKPSIIPSVQGETIEELHDRCAYALASIIAAEDEADSDAYEEGGERAILICTHAASMIAIGRALTGRMPADVCEDDFQTYTCGVSQFRRRTEGPGNDCGASLGRWQEGMAVPRLDWRDGRGVGGGWDCEVNCEYGHLEDGAERGWHFHGDESFIKFDDQAGDAIGGTSKL